MKAKRPAALNRGFTLMELLIAIAIMTVLSIVAIPNFLIWRHNSALNSAARDVLSNFQLAKLTAVQRNTNCAVVFNQAVGGTTYAYVLFIDTNKDVVLDAGEQVVKQVLWSAYDPYVGLDTTREGGDGMSFSTPANGIGFGADGLPKSQGGGMGMGTVYITHAKTGKSLRVVISSAGNVRTEITPP